MPLIPCIYTALRSTIKKAKLKGLPVHNHKINKYLIISFHVKYYKFPSKEILVKG